jgi:dihydroorotate dehydrogenase (NAD+) catalytic subunit
MGGISNAYEVLEMMMAGASLVMIGSENLVNPYACRDIINDLPRVMNEFNIEDLKTIIGKAK